MIHKTFAKYIGYPLHERAKGQATVVRFDDLMRMEQLPASELRRHQCTSLQKLLSHANARSSYYRRRFSQCGFDVAAFSSVEDLQRLPFLTKDDIRANRQALLTLDRDDPGLVPSSTGGSTGGPLRFFVDRQFTANGWAACWRARSWWGLDWGDPWLWLWGSPIEVDARDRMRGAVKRSRDWMLNRRVVSAFDMTEETMAAYIGHLRQERPRYVYAYSSAAYFLAEYVLRSGTDLRSCRPNVIFTTSDALYPHMRETVQRAFHCPVSVEYGSREASFIAHECPEGGLHIHADRVYVEIVDGDRCLPPGESGEIVVTVLDQFAMPFIRYRTADIGSLDPRPCPCGRTLPLLKSIDGRSDDFLVARGDKLIHGQAVAFLLKELDGVARFQIRQEDADHLTIEVVVENPAVQLPLHRIRAGVERVFGYPVDLELRYVDSIPLMPSGKYRPVVSAVARGRIAGVSV